MQVHALRAMVGGWLVGDFSPNIFRSSELEVAVKHYDQGDMEPSHHHKVAEELTLIAQGKARMGEKVLAAGEMALIAPGESTDFEALEKTITVVIKRPSVPNDKYLD